VNLLEDNVDTRKKNTENLIDSKNKVGLEINAEKLSKSCCVISRIQGKIIT
jgi:hypothetical protein